MNPSVQNANPQKRPREEPEPQPEPGPAKQPRVDALVNIAADNVFDMYINDETRHPDVLKVLDKNPKLRKAIAKNRKLVRKIVNEARAPPSAELEPSETAIRLIKSDDDSYETEVVDITMNEFPLVLHPFLKASIAEGNRGNVPRIDCNGADEVVEWAEISELVKNPSEEEDAAIYALLGEPREVFEEGVLEDTIHDTLFEWAVDMVDDPSWLSTNRASDEPPPMYILAPRLIIAIRGS